MRPAVRAAVVALGLMAGVGCARHEPKPAPPAPVGDGPAQGQAAAPAIRVPDDTTQLVVATTADWDATAATVRLWQRPRGGPWSAVGEPWPAVVGRSGLAWGRGLHGDRPPTGHDGPRKHEGDGRSPAGLFTIGPTFGYSAAPPTGARLPYTMATATWRCVDDPASRHYNRLLDEATVTPDWTSREELRRDDELYRWVVEVGHNADGAPGEGSCIFLHVWGGPGTSTAGCTAMDEAVLSGLLGRLDPAAHPVFALLPVAEYATLAPTWELPVD